MFSFIVTNTKLCMGTVKFLNYLNIEVFNIGKNFESARQQFPKWAKIFTNISKSSEAVIRQKLNLNKEVSL